MVTTAARPVVACVAFMLLLPWYVDAGEMPASTLKVARCQRTLNALQISCRCSVNLPISPLRIKQLDRKILDERGAAPAAAGPGIRVLRHLQRAWLRELQASLLAASWLPSSRQHARRR